MKIDRQELPGKKKIHITRGLTQHRFLLRVSLGGNIITPHNRHPEGRQERAL
jgi:hypothetical protein